MSKTFLRSWFLYGSKSINRCLKFLVDQTTNTFPCLRQFLGMKIISISDSYYFDHLKIRTLLKMRFKCLFFFIQSIFITYLPSLFHLLCDCHRSKEQKLSTLNFPKDKVLLRNAATTRKLLIKIASLHNIGNI